MTTGWQLVDNAWYYLNGDGTMATGLTDVNGVKYYLNPEDGRMAVNTELTVGDVTYRADESGGLSAVIPEENQTEGNPAQGNQTEGNPENGESSPGPGGM